MSGSTTSLTPTASVPSITTTIESGSSSPVSNFLSKAKRKKSSTNLQDNPSSVSLSSIENSSAKTSGSSTSYIDKIRKRRAEKKEKERKEAEASLSVNGLPKSRRNSFAGSLGSEASNEAEHDALAIISEPGLVALEPGSTALTSTPTFPISISTSFEDPSTARATQLQVTPDGRPVRRSTSPNNSTSSRDASPTPSSANRTPTVSSGVVIGNIFGMNGKKRSDSTTSNTSGSGGEDISQSLTPRSVPLLQPKTAPSTSLSKDSAVTLTKPDTTVTPPTPIDSPISRPESPSKGGSSPAGSIGTRRGRGSSISKLPSKLSQSSFPDDIHKPLTPTIEVPTPQQTPTVGPGGNATTGFFSNMFTAAQSAASQLSNTIANTSLAPTVKGKKGELGSINTGLANSGTESGASQPNTPGKLNTIEERDRKPLAVETLGQGELSLGSLGITAPDPVRNRRSRPNSTSGDPPETPANPLGLGLTGEGEGEIGQIPKSAGGYLQEKSFDTPLPTPSYIAVNDEGETSAFGRRRSDSVRSSALERSSSRRKRDRGASGATQSSDSAPTPAVRATTFAAASHRRNRDFHALFKNVPSDEQLIEDYGCALQKEILLQGRMYVSEGHICFNSNIFGWVTTLVIPFNDIVAIERRNTAVVFPNAIMIQTLHARNVFASFISRDSTYDLILGLWRTIHPNLKDTANGATLGDEKDFSEGIAEDADGSQYDEDDDYDSAESYSDESPADSERLVPVAAPKTVAKKTSASAVNAAALGAANGVADAAAGPVDFPGPPAHAPTVCGDEASHLERALCDEQISAPLGKVFSVMYGDASYPFLTRLLSEDVKVEQLAIPDDGVFNPSAEYSGKKARSFSYVKPLNASIGPKSTKCLITEVVEQDDLEKAVTVMTYTQTPDVPSGGVFKVLTRTCLMWGDGNSTRIVMNCTIAWSGKSWIKGPIEKGANDGQTNYTKDLLNALRREFAAKGKASAAGAGKGKKKRKADREAGEVAFAAAGHAPAANAAASAAQKWGLLAPVMEPIASIVGEFGAGIIVAVLVFALWLTISRAISGDGGRYDSRGSRRSEKELFDNMWMREEAGLWEWLEDRSRIGDALGYDERVDKRYEKEAKGMRDGIRMQSGNLDPSMVQRQVDEAIRVTEERLGVLKRVNEERRAELLKNKEGTGCGCKKCACEAKKEGEAVAEESKQEV
ncbi:hypothetical protein ABW19_dt0206235 [Dactylella cylindrospora]|nr:hypothetical protein ABW19_dt0206235 [Dactylella cylindrospora]